MAWQAPGASGVVLGAAHVEEHVLEPEPLRRAPRELDARRVQVEAPQSSPGAHMREVHGEHADAAADVERDLGFRQVLPDLLQEALTEDLEASPAVRAHDGVVVAAGDAREDPLVLVHRAHPTRPFRRRRARCDRARGSTSFRIAVAEVLELSEIGRFDPFAGHRERIEGQVELEAPLVRVRSAD